MMVYSVESYHRGYRFGHHELDPEQTRRNLTLPDLAGLKRAPLAPADELADVK